MIYYVKGEYVPQEKRASRSSTAVFSTATRSTKRFGRAAVEILFWKDHLNRLRRSAFLLEMEIDEERADPLRVLRELLRLNGLERRPRADHRDAGRGRARSARRVHTELGHHDRTV